MYKQMNVTIEYGDIAEDANEVEYSFTARDIDFEGKIEIKKCPESTIGIIYQNAKKENIKEDFEKINNSISCL